MRYRLATYRECKAHREWNTTCPDCGRKGKFSPYIDTVTMEPVDDSQCGRCNRLSNCGYHLPPREVARTEDFDSRRSRERRENSDYISSISHANLANHAKFASFHSRIVPRQHSAQPTSCEPSAMGLSALSCTALSPWQGDEHEVRRGYERDACSASLLLCRISSMYCSFGSHSRFSGGLSLNHSLGG